MDDHGGAAGPGEVALRALIQLHFAASEQGIGPAARAYDEPRWTQVLAACARFELRDLAPLLQRARACAAGSEEEAALHEQYARRERPHLMLHRAFLRDFQREPGAYAPSRRAIPEEVVVELAATRRSKIGTATGILVLLALFVFGAGHAASRYVSYTQTRKLEALEALLKVDQTDAVRTFSGRQGGCPWQRWELLPLPPPEHGDTATEMLHVEIRAPGPMPRGWPGKGVVVQCDGDRPHLDPAQLKLRSALRTDRPEQIAWFAFIARGTVEDAFHYGRSWVSVGRADFVLVDALNGETLAVGAVVALPPPSLERGAEREVYPLSDASLARLVERAVDTLSRSAR